MLLYLMGSQEVGGHVELKQVDIADALDMDPAQVSRAQTKLKKLGLAYSPNKGSIQLQPAATLRGGLKVVNQPVRGAVKRPVKVHIDQLSLLNELVGDDGVPEEFKKMARPGARLPEPRKTRRRRATQKQKQKPEA
ncbi:MULTISPECIES: hypothetical protein [unclassified Streptomyces]|uniref:hypothetical protein n=1 Tax=unclassified Streptomyces TaxID=2593676 RepID=UPI00035DB9FD|nr:MULTISPECIES: hypothetical protein [unclassified Streptomyces]